MVSATKSAGQTSEATFKLHWDVNERPMPESLKTLKLDHQFEWKSGETLESALTRAGVKNIGKAIEHGLSIFIDGGNILFGAGQVTVGGIAGILTSLDDAAFATFASVLNSGEWLLKFDDDFKAHSDGYNKRSTQIRDNLTRIKTNEEWKVFVDGLTRIRNGAGFTIADAVGMPKDLLDATLELAGGITLGAGKPLVAAILEVLSWPFAAVSGITGLVSDATGYIREKLHKGAVAVWNSSEFAKID